jgi:hypothetical protein
MDLIPTRIIVNADGYARRPKPGDKIDVVFVRDDGWSLGAPRAFRNIAYQMWPREWVTTVEFDPTLVVPDPAPAPK